MNYTQKRTYSTALSDIKLIANAIKQAGYVGADAQRARHSLLQAADALEAAMEESDVA